MEIRFSVPGTIRGKQRARSGNGHHYTPAQTVNYQETVRAYYAQAAKGKSFGKQKVRALIHARFALPKSRRLTDHPGQFCDKAPDGDNIAKIILDALNGVAYDDDRRVPDQRVIKVWDYAEQVDVSLSIAEEPAKEKL